MGRKAATGALVLLLLRPPCAAAKGMKDIELRKDLIHISAPQEDGKVTVAGAPGAVMRKQRTAMLTFLLENSDTDEKMAGVVNDDGSFAARIAAHVDDKIKLVVYTTASGKKAKFKEHVPPPSAPPRPAPPPAERAVSLPRQGPSPSPRRMPVRRGIPTPAPEIVIRYKGKPDTPLPAAETAGGLDMSGILPPD